MRINCRMQISVQHPVTTTVSTPERGSVIPRAKNASVLFFRRSVSGSFRIFSASSNSGVPSPGGGSDRSKTPRPGLMAVGDSGDGKSQLPAPAEKRLFRVVVRMGEGGGVEFDSNQAFAICGFFYKKKGERKSLSFLPKSVDNPGELW